MAAALSGGAPALADIHLDRHGRHKLGVLLDLRLALSPRQTVSRDRGVGLLRTGGQDLNGTRIGTSRQLRPFLGQLGLEFTGRFGKRTGYLVELSSQVDGHQRTVWSVPEAFLTHEAAWHSAKLSTRAGFLIPPFSMEHPGVAWSTFFTLTPSAINAWLAEEVRSAGAESTYSLRLGQSSKGALTVGGFYGADPSGVLLSWRGWAMHDLQAGIGERVQFAGHPGIVSPAAFGMPKPYTRPFQEMDDKPGWYYQARHQNKKWIATGGYWANKANPREIDRDHVYGWGTSFHHFGWRHEKPDRSWLFQSQWMDGHTRMGGGNPSAVENDFRSFYVMASKPTGQGRFTLRYDHFQVDDRDGQKGGDLNGQRGHAVTFAWTRRLNEESDLVAELVQINSKRPIHAAIGQKPGQSESQFQVAWRHYK